MTIKKNKNSLPSSPMISEASDSFIESRQVNRLEQLLSSLTFNKWMPNKKNVAVISFNGLIVKGSTYKSHFNFEAMNDLIEKAFSTPKTTLAVCLVVNSPGGSPVQTELIAKRIKSLSLKTKIPVYSFVEDIAASGGYWLACAGQEIYASRSSIIGSIGVITAGFGFQDAIQKHGVERRVFTSGKNKSVLDPFQPVKEEDVKLILKLQEQVHKSFIEYVKMSRSSRLTQSDEVLFNGEFWGGDTAYDYGLIDGIDDLYHFVKKKYGDEVKIDYLTPKRSWLKTKLGITQELVIEKFVDIFFERIEAKVENTKYNLK